MNFTPEMLNIAKNAKTAEELIALARENNVEVSEEEIKAYFEKTHTKYEMTDDELNNVVGGGCGKDEDKPLRYTYGAYTYTHGGPTKNSQSGCQSITGYAQCPSTGSFVGKIYFYVVEEICAVRWFVVCDICGARYDGAGSPADRGFYPA